MCSVRYSLSLDSGDDTVWHLRCSPCDLGIQSHSHTAHFVQYGSSRFPFSQCVTASEFQMRLSEQTNERPSKYYFLFQTTAHSCVCINVLLHQRMDFDGMFGLKTNTLCTALALSPSRFFALALARRVLYCLYTIHMYEICIEHWQRVCLLCALFLFLFLSRNHRLHASVVYNTHGVYSHTYIQCSK